MSNYTIGDGSTVQSQQNSSPSDNYILEGSSTIVGAGAGTFFGSNTPGATSTLFLTGVSAVPGGYKGDVGVLGSAHAEAILGGISPTVFGGTGTANIYVQTAGATIVTGSGDMNIIGDASGAGVNYGGGAASITHTTTGDVVRTGLGATVHLWTSGTVA